MSRHPIAFADPATAEYESVESQTLEGHLGEITSHHQFSRAHVTSWSDELHPVVVREVDERSQSQRHHPDRSTAQRPGHLGGSGARVEYDGLSVGDEPRDSLRNSLFHFDCFEDAHRIGHFVASQIEGHRTSTFAAEYSIAFKDVKVAANRHFRTAKRNRQLAHRNALRSHRLDKSLAPRPHIHNGKNIKNSVSSRTRFCLPKVIRRSYGVAVHRNARGERTMPYVTANDGAQIFYKDWGEGQPIVFHHGWPLSSDDWDAQMMFFLQHGYRVIAHDRRGHGRSSQTSDGHDMDTYAADAAAVANHLDLHDAIHIGHSTGGGEVARYVGQYRARRIAKAVLISAVPPLMVKTDANPGGTPIEVFDNFREGTAFNRAQFFLEVASGPFYGFNRPGATVLEGVIRNWWRQGMMGSVKAHYEGIKAFSETDQTEDLKAIEVPTLVMHGDDDQVVPIADASLLTIKLLQKGTLKVYPGFPHGMCTTHADVINADLLAFIQS